MQVHVLKRMGGMQENCHTCRLLDVMSVKGMTKHYGSSSSLPSSLDDFCKNDIPKGRKGKHIHAYMMLHVARLCSPATIAKATNLCYHVSYISGFKVTDIVMT